ncbi:NADH-quinone oxidoreductase subunit NuoH [Archaeoglobus neptunius]|uniref:NADH-quinone oxidoreductase subunit NuoH n=1 Tax=Archaeoglobus neptunius TaxID=2798580 RepID=UPI001E611DA6|nr:NADH-quinone oxidoreductase subunit NuoH [Archaeoglobus neptunius]
MVVEILNYIYQIFSSNMMNIPLIAPIVDYLMKIPLINIIVALILWKPFFSVIIMPGLAVLMVYLLYIVWYERKLTARIQWRVGPLEVFRPLRGAIQALADGIRYFFQEAIIHRDAHRPYFVQLPILAFIPVLLPLIFIPAGSAVGIYTPYAIQLIVTFIALIPITIVAIGWAANNRFAFIGSVREAFMYFAYEVPLLIAVISMIFLYGSGDPYVAVEKQGIIPGAVLNPVAFIVYIIAMLMATSRLPFEIPEADQEIAFGPFVEYSGILFGLVMVLAYEKLYIMTLLFTILFLGGWNGIYFPLLGDLNGPLWMTIKTFVVISVLVIVRSIYARYRLDQALRISWTSMLALSIIALIIGGAVGVWLS